MKERTPVAREACVKARREADACKRSKSWNRLCEDLELGVNGTKSKFLPKWWPTETFQHQS